MKPYQVAHTARGPIEYRLEGSGPVVLVLNGGNCSRDTRLSHERLAAHGFTVLTPSRPGYDSTPSAVGRTAQAAADALAALLDSLQISTVDVIGISAAGPTALAFAQRHPGRIRKLVLESAMATDWERRIKLASRLGFGRAGKLTWGMAHLLLRLAPALTIRAILRGITVLDPGAVLRRMSPDDLAFVERMLLACEAGEGFANDVEHRLEDLSAITVPVLAMFSPNDRIVSPRNSRRVAAEVATCELYEVPADTHLLWIGPSAPDVWAKRLSFLTS